MIASVDLKNKALQWGALSLVLSLSVHVLLVFSAFFWTHWSQPERVAEQSFPMIELRFLNEVETFQEESLVAPDDASFTSTKNLKTAEETSPDLETHDLIQAPSMSARPRIESFSLSEADKIEMQQMIVQAETFEAKLAPSKGFIERLRRGEDLKVNAFRYDTNGYVSRMKGKIGVTWNPRSTYSLEMTKFDRVIVTLGIVLSKEGELLDLWIIQPSFFEAYDREALRTVRESVPFPNPPDYLVQDDGKIYMPWSFLLYTGQQGFASIE
ncbi:MAG: energy transducer TonB family protein [Bdellovibrionota bacterium]